MLEEVELELDDREDEGDNVKGWYGEED